MTDDPWNPSAAECAGYAHGSEFENAEEPLGDFDWVYVPRYPIERIADVGSEQDWIRWMRDEIQGTAEDGDPHRWDCLLNEEIQEPIIVSERKGRGSIWGGFHRTGACFMTGRKHIPAVIGVLKGIDRTALPVFLRHAFEIQPPEVASGFGRHLA